jgi:hypothetical protein
MYLYCEKRGMKRANFNGLLMIQKNCSLHQVFLILLEARDSSRRMDSRQRCNGIALFLEILPFVKLLKNKIWNRFENVATEDLELLF